MHGDIVASNFILEDRANALRSFLSSDTSLRIFVNDFQPLPTDPIGNFVEAFFAGYARINMNAQWQIVRKQADGNYVIVSNAQNFVGGVGASQTVYGWFIVKGGKVLFSARLPVPQTMVNGTRLQVKISLNTAAASLGLCSKCG